MKYATQDSVSFVIAKPATEQVLLVIVVII